MSLLPPSHEMKGKRHFLYPLVGVDSLVSHIKYFSARFSVILNISIINK